MSAELHILVLARPSTALQGGAAVDRDPISPSVPVLNSACPWASSYEDLVSLYESPWTSAVTTRTATLRGFQEDAAVHKVAFFSTSNAGPSTSTINSYGYSPFPLAAYVDWVRTILSQANNVKPIIISISDSLSNLPALLEEISVLRASLNDSTAPRVGVEFNASCPNIPGYPPPSYDGDELAKYLEVLASYVRKDPTLTIGVKLPPYVYQGQFDAVIRALKSIKGASSTRHPISFLTCTNTLGNGLVFGDQTDGRTADFAVPTAFGGLGGETIHQISLGNVHKFWKLLRSDRDLKTIAIIGVGGVIDAAGVERMRRAGAHAVACATALGREGVGIFERLVPQPTGPERRELMESQ